MCLGFGWARSFVHCGEKVLNSKAVSRIMSLTLSEPVSSSIKGGNIYVCPPPQQYREDKRIKTMVYRSLHVWCEHQVRCSMLLFSHFLDEKSWGNLYKVNRRCPIRIVYVPFWEPIILAAMQHCLSNVMLTRHFILYINIYRKHKIEWFSKKCWNYTVSCQCS